MTSPLMAKGGADPRASGDRVTGEPAAVGRGRGEHHYGPADGRLAASTSRRAGGGAGRAVAHPVGILVHMFKYFFTSYTISCTLSA